MNNPDFKEFIYIDKSGIDSLFAQLSETLILEQTIEKSKNKSGKISGKAETSAPFKLFSLGIGAEGGTNNYQSLIEKRGLAYEQKISSVINSQSLIYKSLDDAISMYNSASGLIVVNELFYTHQLFDSAENLKEVYKSEYLFFERQPKFKFDDQYEYSDEYYKHDRQNTSLADDVRIIMQLAINKLTTSFGGITSHLATRIRLSKGRNLKFGLVGRLYRINDQLYQIKPYAVWQ